MVTVVLTVYNRTHYIIEAIESVPNQTYEAWELIIADDSGCRLAEPVYAAYQHDTRVHYSPNQTTVGVAINLRQAINSSTADYIAILNDDDRWVPTFLASLVKPLADDKTLVLAFCDHWIMDEQGQTDQIATDRNTARYKRHTLPEGLIQDTTPLVLLHNAVPVAMAAMFRRDALDLSRLTNEVAGAYDFWIACLLSATTQPFYYVHGRLTYYRIHHQMETGRRSLTKNINQVYIYCGLLTSNYFPAFKPWLITRYALALYSVGKDNLYFGHRRAARSYFKQAMSTHGTYRPIIGWLATFLPARLLQRASLYQPTQQ